MHADDVEQLESLKDVAHRLFPDEGGRVQTGGRMGGKLNAFLGSLLPKLPTCFDCPQYGAAIIYPRKCYYQRGCIWPAFIQILRFKVRAWRKERAIVARIKCRVAQLGRVQ